MKIESAFTLLEVLVTIAVISVLATVLVLAINPGEMLRRSRDSKRLSDIGTIRRAVDLALADDQDMLATLGVIDINTSTDVTNFAGAGIDLSRYLPVIPQDPSYSAAGGSAQVIAADCTNGTIAEISYKFWSDGEAYILRANMESLSNCEIVQNDGNNNSTYEVGTEPGLDAI